MKIKENITEKLTKIAAGATIITYFAIGTGCDDAQQIRKISTEDVTNNDNENTKNDDKDTAFDTNDNDFVENNGEDNKDDTTNINDENYVNPSDNEGKPTENNDSEEPTDVFLNSYYVDFDMPEDIVATKDEMQTGNGFDKIIETQQKNHELCPYSYNSNSYTDSDENIRVVDYCVAQPVDFESEPIIWLENVVPTVFNKAGLSPDTPHRIVYMQANYSNNEGSKIIYTVDIKIKNMVFEISFESNYCLKQATSDNLATINPAPQAECSATPTLKKAITSTQHKTRDADTNQQRNETLCATMPNHKYDKEKNTCYTSISDFILLENVTHTLLNREGFSWTDVPYTVISMNKKGSTAHIDMLVNNMNVQVELMNTKSCIDTTMCEKQGSSCIPTIRPEPNAYTNCEYRYETKNIKSKQNSGYKIAPKFNKPNFVVPRKHYVKNIRNFGHNGR